MDYVYISKNGLENLKAELKNLKENVRPEISKRIEEARAHGDLKENAEYDAAREHQGITEARIREVEDRIARAKVIDDADIPADAIYIGATVTLFDQDMDLEVVYTLVPEDEADFAEGKIAVTSPVGKALLGYKTGDEVKIEVPARTIVYKVLNIERL